MNALRPNGIFVQFDAGITEGGRLLIESDIDRNGQ